MQRRGRLDEADQMFRELLELCAAQKEAVPHIVAIFENNYGDCLMEQKRHEEAEKYLAPSLGVIESKFGAEHARTIAQMLRERWPQSGRLDAGRGRNLIAGS